MEVFDRKGNLLTEGDYLIHCRDMSNTLWQLTSVFLDKYQGLQQPVCNLKSFYMSQVNDEIIFTPKTSHSDIPIRVTKELFIKYPPNLPKTLQSIRAYGVLCGVEWRD